MPLIAVLGRDHILETFERVEVHLADSERRIEVPDPCDLIPGRYLWRHDRKRFVPVDDPDENNKNAAALEVAKLALMTIGR